MACQPLPTMSKSEPNPWHFARPELAQKYLQTFAPNLRAAVGSLLESIGVSRETAAREIAAMESVTFGRATNRRVLGSIIGSKGNAVSLSRGVTHSHSVDRRNSRDRCF